MLGGKIKESERIYAWFLIANGLIGLGYAIYWFFIANYVIGLPRIHVPFISRPLSTNEAFFLIFMNASLLPLFGVIVGALCLRGKPWALWISLIFYLMQFVTVQTSEFRYSYLSGLHININTQVSDSFFSVNVLAIIFFAAGLGLIAERYAHKSSVPKD